MDERKRVNTGRFREITQELNSLNSEYLEKRENLRKNQDFSKEFKDRKFAEIEAEYLRKAQGLKEEGKKVLETMKSREEVEVPLDDTKLFNALRLLELYGQDIDRGILKGIIGNFTGRQASLQVIAGALEKHGISTGYAEAHMYSVSDVYNDLYTMFSANCKGLKPIKNELELAAVIDELESKNNEAENIVEIAEITTPVQVF